MPTPILIAAIRFYQKAISPMLPTTCRFQPSCSAYALEAITTHGGLRGGWLAIRRLMRCRPFGRWGFDPVPPVRNECPGGVLAHDLATMTNNTDEGS